MREQSVFHFTCGCGKALEMELSTRDDSSAVAERRKRIAAAGWVVVTDTGQLADVTCSVECRNRGMRESFANRERLNRFWWKEGHGFTGEPPPCTCTLALREDGLLFEQRTPDCPMDSWFDDWTRRLQEQEQLLYQSWLNVPVGTAVVEEFRPTTEGRLQRKFGQIVSPPVFVETTNSCWTFINIVEKSGGQSRVHARHTRLLCGRCNAASSRLFAGGVCSDCVGAPRPVDTANRPVRMIRLGALSKPIIDISDVPFGYPPP